jgi:beta-lactamase superfamily II metal-dependent hydrolase
MPTVRRTRRLIRWAAALVALLISLASFAAAPALAQHLRIYYPDIEQGSATLVVSPTGVGLLVDAGSELSAADDDIVLFLEDLVDQGILASLDYLVATHYDEDHIGRLDHVMAYGPISPTLVAPMASDRLVGK